MTDTKIVRDALNKIRLTFNEAAAAAKSDKEALLAQTDTTLSSLSSALTNWDVLTATQKDAAMKLMIQTLVQLLKVLPRLLRLIEFGD